MIPPVHSQIAWQTVATGVVLVALSVVGLLTGWTFEKYQGTVSRKNNPTMFWASVVGLAAIGLLFIVNGVTDT
jgi:succinate dehydrogenase hydrophobic anchor subunit